MQPDEPLSNIDMDPVSAGREGGIPGMDVTRLPSGTVVLEDGMLAPSGWWAEPVL